MDVGHRYISTFMCWLLRGFLFYTFHTTPPPQAPLAAAPAPVAAAAHTDALDAPAYNNMMGVLPLCPWCTATSDSTDQARAIAVGGCVVLLVRQNNLHASASIWMLLLWCCWCYICNLYCSTSFHARSLHQRCAIKQARWRLRLATRTQRPLHLRGLYNRRG